MSCLTRIIPLPVCLLLCIACSRNTPPSLSIQPNAATIPAEGGQTALHIKSNTDWSLSGVPAYIRASSVSGKGDITVTFTVEQHLLHTARSASMIITAVEVEKPQTFSIAQERYSGNHPPAPPVLIAPAPQATQVHPHVTFSWEPSTDANGDEVRYALYYRLQGQYFEATDCGTNTRMTLPAPLTGESVYEWYVIAMDGYDYIKSETQQFSTSVSPYYEEGEVRLLLQNRPVNGVNLVFLCDGFVADDLEKGGACDQAVAEALGYFLDVEPYKSYYDYFNAYVVYSFSAERGASYGAVNTIKNTSFGITCDKDSRTSTLMSGDSVKVFRYAKKAPVGAIDETLIIVISQDSRYAGTCYMWGSRADWGGGKAIALTTMSQNTYPYNFKGTVQHEAGGHAFAKLADEYVSEPAAKDRNRNDVGRMYADYGFYGNVDTTSNLSLIRWAAFIGRPGYEAVSAYQGGYYFATGVWRPEASSCMTNNIAYFNAPSRAAIVRRIKNIAREEFDFDEFWAKDVATKPTFAPALPTKLQEHLHLAPPVVIKE